MLIMFLLPFIVAVIVAFILCIVFIPILIKISIKNHWYDEVDDRKIHTGKISRLAGVAIFWSMLGTIIISIIFIYVSPKFQIDIPITRVVSFLFAVMLVHFVGLLDDFKNIRPRFKFLVQLIAVGIVIFPNNTFSQIYLPFVNININIGFLGYFLSAIWIIGACNAVNLIDGVDGLSGGITAIAALVISIIALLMGNFITAIIAFSLFGSIIGFLVFNLPPAKIFMGDSGSLFLGFLISSLPLLEIKNFCDLSLVISISVLFVPVVDTLTSMLRRIMRKQSPFFPDREHIHHKLMNKNYSTKKILFILYSVSILVGSCIVLWATTGKYIYININICLWIFFIFISLLLERHHAKKNSA